MMAAPPLNPGRLGNAPSRALAHPAFPLRLSPLLCDIHSLFCIPTSFSLTSPEPRDTSNCPWPENKKICPQLYPALTDLSLFLFPSLPFQKSWEKTGAVSMSPTTCPSSCAVGLLMPPLSEKLDASGYGHLLIDKSRDSSQVLLCYSALLGTPSVFALCKSEGGVFYFSLSVSLCLHF